MTLNLQYIYNTKATNTRNHKKMSRKYARLCSLGSATTCFRLHCLPIRSKPELNFIENGQKSQFLSNGRDQNGEVEMGNKIMVVVDSSSEAKGALDWALSHTVQAQDTIVLLHVANYISKQGTEANGTCNLMAMEFIHSMKKMCQTRRPGVKVEIVILEGKERGTTIVEEAKRQRVSLLVLGQKRKRPIWWQLVNLWRRRRRNRMLQVVDYCIQNASCMTIAVRKKSNKLGGYLITTKRHKDFWLLA